MRVIALALVALVALVALGCKTSAPPPSTTKAPISNTSKQQERLAVAIVLAAHEIWLGNDQIEPAADDKGVANPAYFPGALTGIHAALAKRSLADAAGPNAKGALVLYGTGASLKLPMGPITQLDVAAFGTQRDYYMKIGTDLVSGVQRAIGELERTEAERKLLLVVGDGNDTNLDAAKPQLAAMRERVATSRIDVRAVVWKSSLSVSEFTVITSLTDRVTFVQTADGVGPAMLDAVDSARR